MKKTIYLPIALVILTGCSLIPFNYQKTISIDYSFAVVFKQLKAVNWKKWQPQLAAIYARDSARVITTQNTQGFNITAPGITINGTTTDGFKYNISKIVNGKITRYEYVAVPQSNEGKCSVITTYKTNTFELAAALFNGSHTDVSYLKSYLNNIKAYYGYDIKRGKVIDSNILVQKLTVPNASKTAAIIKVQQQLNTYLNQHNLKQEQPIMADIRPLTKDSTLIMIGIPIAGQTQTNGNFKFMHLPPNGNMLSARYKGPYAGRSKLYDALKAYFAEHGLSAPEIPYEKFYDNKIPLSDTATVDMQINYPIF